MVFTWYRELGLAIEKHSTTTSDLKERGGRHSLNPGSTSIVLADWSDPIFYNTLPAVCKTPVLVVVPESIPETEGHTDFIHHISGAL